MVRKLGRYVIFKECNEVSESREMGKRSIGVPIERMTELPNRVCDQKKVLRMG